uniref:Ig-like domain-containing protein n=1 Tax=Lepisosteus oculatus TaxID=7918 RepID=W5LXI6_LEPOC
VLAFFPHRPVSSEHVPVTAKFGDSVTLPCDVEPYSLGIPERKLHVFWETLDYCVYEFMGGKGYPDNRFQNRVEMSREKISRVDLSLTVHHTTFSDGQIYTCYLIADKEHLLQRVDLAVLAHSEVHSLQPGASLSHPLNTAGPAEVLFDPAGSVQSPRDFLSSAGLPGPGYEQRVSVQNSSLTLRSLIPVDRGSYTVRDLQGNTISTVIVTV